MSVMERDGFSSPQPGAGGFGMGILRWDGYPGGNVVCSGAGWIGTTWGSSTGTETVYE